LKERGKQATSTREVLFDELALLLEMYPCLHEAPLRICCIYCIEEIPLTYDAEKSISTGGSSLTPRRHPRRTVIGNRRLLPLMSVTICADDAQLENTNFFKDKQLQQSWAPRFLSARLVPVKLLDALSSFATLQEPAFLVYLRDHLSPRLRKKDDSHKVLVLFDALSMYEMSQESMQSSSRCCGCATPPTYP
jgi:hypothetical protein